MMRILRFFGIRIEAIETLQAQAPIIKWLADDDSLMCYIARMSRMLRCSNYFLYGDIGCFVLLNIDLYRNAMGENLTIDKLSWSH